MRKLESYNKLREAHKIITDILYGDTDKMTAFELNAIEAIHSVLYMAEGLFV